MLWGLYHGLLVVISGTLGRWLRLPERWPGPLALVQIVLTVSLAMAGWLLFRETDPQYLRRFLLLSPADSTPDERMLGWYLVAMTATWAVPLFVDDLWALARERQPWLADWMVGRATRPGFVGAQLAGAGVLVTLILVLRSHVSLDFIYFQF